MTAQRQDAAIAALPVSGIGAVPGRIESSAFRAEKSGRLHLIVAASAIGTAFEWYDFFVYGALASIIGRNFFPSGNPTLQVLLVWAGFSIGFCFRPVGAILFGYLGDRFGRKYTFLATVSIMGLSTVGIGLLPPASSIGLAAPLLLIAIRVLQGLAVGGELGGAVTYVFEHAPPHRKGFLTSFIFTGGSWGIILSFSVVLALKNTMSMQAWQAWGWRLPFLFSFVLLSISLWMRMKLSESPVFKAMRAQGKISRNPFVECFTCPGNLRRLFVATIGIAAGMNVLLYTLGFRTFDLLQSSFRLEETSAEFIVMFALAAHIVAALFFGRLSDRIDAKRLLVWSYGLSLVLIFPVFWAVGNQANPNLARASAAAPVVVIGPDCAYNPFASEQRTRCGKLLGDLADTGVAFTHKRGSQLAATVGGRPLPLSDYRWLDKTARHKQLHQWLSTDGYDLAKVRPPLASAVLIGAGLATLFIVTGACVGPAPALMAALFPPHIRYSSLSLPYHIGAGYFGGFVPLISAYIVARVGNPYAGLWYSWTIVALALLVTLWGLSGTKKSAGRALHFERG